MKMSNHEQFHRRRPMGTGLKLAIGAVSGLMLIASPTLAFADKIISPAPTQKLVALGDSITFGWNMKDTKNNTAVSAFAFPQLLGTSDNIAVTNRGVGGWTSDDLLNALTTDTSLQTDVKQANLITLDIGNNDLLHLATPLVQAAEAGQPITVTDDEKAQFAEAIQHYGDNLPKIVASIRQLTNAPILMYNIYNPFPSASPIGSLTNTMILPMNQIITQVAAASQLRVIDAHKAFADNDSHLEQLVRLQQNDVHPTLVGQYVLAQLANDALVGKASTQALQPHKSRYGLSYNGNDVDDTAAHTVKVNGQWLMYSSVDLFAKAWGTSFEWDKKTNTLTINGTKMDNKYGSPHIHAGVLTAPVIPMVRAYMASIGGATMTSEWVTATSTANVTVLPKGYTSNRKVVPGVGQQWSNPGSSPYGLVFGTYQGKLIFEEYRYDHPDTSTVPELGVPHLPSGLIVPRIEHVELTPQLSGEEGLQTPHVDERMYFISPADEKKIK